MHFICRYNDQSWEWHGNSWTTRETSAEYYVAWMGKEKKTQQPQITKRKTNDSIDKVMQIGN